MTAPYATGTITLTNGSNVITGTGTGWQTSLVVGGIVYPEAANGNAMPIVTVDSDTKITAATKWKGANGTYPYAIMRDTAYGQQSVANAQALATQIQRLNNAVLSGLAALTPAANKAVTFGETGEAALSDLSPFGRSLIAVLNSSAAYGALGEVPDGQLPTRLREFPTFTSNWNDAKKSGFYFGGSSTVNTPAQPFSFVGEVIAQSSAYCVQRLTALGISNPANNVIFERQLVNDVWSAWYRRADVSGPGAAVKSRSIAGFAGTSGQSISELTVAEGLSALGPVFGGNPPVPSAAGVGLSDGDFNAITVGGLYTTTGSYANGPHGNPATHAGIVEVYTRYQTGIVQIYRSFITATLGLAYRRVGTRSSGTDPWTWTAWGITEGDVTGPGSAGNNRIAVFSGTSGRIIYDAGLNLADIAKFSDIYTRAQTYTQAQTQSLVTTARQVRLAGLGEIGTTVFAWNEAAAGCVFTGVFLDGNWGVRNYRYRAIQQTDLSGNWVTVAQA